MMTVEDLSQQLNNIFVGSISKIVGQMLPASSPLWSCVENVN